MRAISMLLFCCLLAGCLQDRGQESPDRSDVPCTDCPATTATTSSMNPPQAPPAMNGTQSLQLFDCVLYLLQVPIDAEALAAATPTGYEANAVPPLAGLDAFLCKRAVLGNDTVLQDVQWYMVSAEVSAPGEVQNPDGADLFVYELCVNHPAIAGHLTMSGMSVCQGVVAMTESAPSVSLAYDGESGPRYSFNGVGEVDRPTVGLAEEIRFHQDDVWFSFSWEPAYPSPPGETGPLEVAGGFLAGVTMTPTGPARGGIGTADSIIVTTSRT